MGVTRVGCAGWSYRDWVGAVYPSHLQPNEWLDAYADLFPLVEIDSTFHGLPTRPTVDAWIQRAQAHPDFRFTVQAPQELTHRVLPKGNHVEAKRVVHAFFERVVAPLERSNVLEAILISLPPSFALFEQAGTQTALEALDATLELFEPRQRKVAVEFRHGSWYEHVGERLVPEVVEALAGLHVAAAQVDGLGNRFTKSRTTPWTYFRLHGRRTEIPPSERNLSHAPYNYLYTKDEISEVAAVVRDSERGDQGTIVIFNNHYRGQSANNAMDLLEALGRPRPRPAKEFKRESRLDDFGLSATR